MAASAATADASSSTEGSTVFGGFGRFMAAAATSATGSGAGSGGSGSGCSGSSASSSRWTSAKTLAPLRARGSTAGLATSSGASTRAATSSGSGMGSALSTLTLTVSRFFGTGRGGGASPLAAASNICALDTFSSSSSPRKLTAGAGDGSPFTRPFAARF